MIYNEYGRTGKKVSAIGFGGMRFANPDDIEQSAALVREAWEKGINYFDTAPGYGKSEDIYGTAFKTMLKERGSRPFHVATKSFGGTNGEIRADLERSLKRMGLDRIDFLHSWCIMDWDDFEGRRKGGAFTEMLKIKEEGLASHVCVSTHMQGTDIAQMLDEFPFEGILLGYSAMNFPYREAGVAAAAAKNMGVVVMNPLGGGIIPSHPDRFSFLKTQPDESVVEAALRFLLNDLRITVSLVGISCSAQLDEAIRAADGFKPIPDTGLARLKASLNEGMDKLCTGCGYCNGCPQGIPITKFMDAYNTYMLSSGAKEKAMLDRLKWHWGIENANEALSACTDCGRCEELCTRHLPIVERFRETRRADRAKDGAS